ALGPVAAAVLPAPEAWPQAVLAAIAFAAAGAAGAWFLLRGLTVRALAASAAGAVVAHGVLFGLAAPALKPLWLSQRAADALSHADLTPREGITAGPVASAGYDEPSLVFALGAKTELGDGQTAADAIADGRPAIVEQRQQAAFARALAANGDAARPVAVIEGLDYSNGRHDILRLYRPAPEAKETP
ncbi:MAG TPA: hypothetical protein VG939_06145, partial [Caulobacteraceae bacterium]|nr:hypothetical protein [Caulobacteraceae bacterium]